MSDRNRTGVGWARFRRHPSKRALREWLAGEMDEQVDAHVSTCDRCSNDLEALASADLGAGLRDALLEVLDPTPDRALRVEAGVVARLESREGLGYFADVFGAGGDTRRLRGTDEQRTDQPEENPPA